ncbi:MAG TPA: peptidoglycan-binding domain-containing protein [Pyrinomonadaceae bacterium]|nr:peptidoglycan-binding domain-containing protein [Pyrinomonadaceae bacterium]
MRKLFFVVLVWSMCAFSAFSQTAPSAPATVAPPVAAAPAPEKAKRPPVFRATKAQIKEVQTMLAAKKLYAGEATGKLDDTTRTSIKSFQKDNGLKETGTLNRATLEKMSIELTDTQQAIPVSPKSFAVAETTTAAGEPKPKRVIFRATKGQIMEAQKLLKTKGMYAGEETGKLDDDTRGGLKKFQTENGVKVTGTLNQITLEKMGIDLTDKQKGSK